MLRTLTITTAFLGLCTLGACKPADQPAAGGSEASMDAVTATGTPTGEAAGPDAKPGIVAAKARLVLPVIAGRPAAAYFSLHNEGPATATLVAVHVAGAGKAEMHRTQGGSMAPIDKLDIVPGGALDFSPGNFHVMVFDLDPALKPGGTGEITLTFSDGDKVSLPLAIEAMGTGSQSMSGHDMGGMDMQH